MKLNPQTGKFSCLLTNCITLSEREEPKAQWMREIYLNPCSQEANSIVSAPPLLTNIGNISKKMQLLKDVFSLLRYPNPTLRIPYLYLEALKKGMRFFTVCKFRTGL